MGPSAANLVLLYDLELVRSKVYRGMIELVEKKSSRFSRKLQKRFRRCHLVFAIYLFIYQQIIFVLETDLPTCMPTFYISNLKPTLCYVYSFCMSYLS